eukprot:55623-Amorphochlora_amoeboformis.AAC.1
MLPSPLAPGTPASAPETPTKVNNPLGINRSEAAPSTPSKEHEKPSGNRRLVVITALTFIIFYGASVTTEILVEQGNLETLAEVNKILALRAR